MQEQVRGGAQGKHIDSRGVARKPSWLKPMDQIEADMQVIKPI